MHAGHMVGWLHTLLMIQRRIRLKWSTLLFWHLDQGQNWKDFIEINFRKETESGMIQMLSVEILFWMLSLLMCNSLNVLQRRKLKANYWKIKKTCMEYHKSCRAWEKGYFKYVFEWIWIVHKLRDVEYSTTDRAACQFCVASMDYK